MGFGTEIFFFAGLAALILGPKRLHTVIRHVTRRRARFEKITEVFKSQILEELGTEHTEKPKLPL